MKRLLIFFLALGCHRVHGAMNIYNYFTYVPSTTADQAYFNQALTRGIQSNEQPSYVTTYTLAPNATAYAYLTTTNREFSLEATGYIKLMGVTTITDKTGISGGFERTVDFVDWRMYPKKFVQPPADINFKVVSST